AESTYNLCQQHLLGQVLAVLLLLELQPVTETMSGNSKYSLTDNGVVTLYNRELKNAVTVQVIFLATTELTCYIRVSDGKHLSPVILLFRKHFNPTFGVGAIISIKEAQILLLEENTVRQYHLEDEGMHRVFIRSYALLESHATIFGPLDITGTYRDAINHVYHILKKIDPKIDQQIKWDPKRCKDLQSEGEIMRENGNQFFKHQEYIQAVSHYDIAKKKDPFDYRAYYRAGQAAFKQSNSVAAGIYAQNGLMLCGKSKDLQQLFEEAFSLNADGTNVRIKPFPLNSLGNMENIPALISAVCRSSKYFTPYGSSKCIFERSLAIGKKSKGRDGRFIGQGMEPIKEFGVNFDNEDPTKEQKKERKKNKIKNFKLPQGENIREQEEKKIKGEKRKEKEEDRKKVEFKRDEERILMPRNVFHETLREGRRFYDIGQYRQAIEAYSRSLVYCCPDGDTNSVVNEGKERVNVQVIQYVVGTCKIQSGRGYILDGMEIMKALSEDDSNFSSKPAAHYWLGIGYEKIFLYKMAHYHAWACREALKAQKDLEPIKWPGSDDIIVETVPDTLRVEYEVIIARVKMYQPPEDEALNVWQSLPVERAFVKRLDNIPLFYDKHKFFERIIYLHINDSSKELIGRAASIRPTPKAKCRFKDCINIQGHNYAKEEIYLTDPDFKGFLDVICEEFCNISYHPCCWKAHKERFEEGIGRKSDKDFIGLDCITPDCTGKICSIRIYDETGRLKNELVKDKKERRNGAVVLKPKKKKDKKKEKTQPTKGGEAREKKKSKIPVPSNLPIDPESLDSSAVIILKPTAGEEDVSLTKPPKKNKKKNKKNKTPAQPDLIGDPLETDQSVQNEYLSRLRALRQQREALEGDMSTPRKATSLNLSAVSNDDIRKWIDPNKPFYMPRHLRDNPQQLESILQTKMKTTTSTDLSKESINTLLDFMYDWLKSEGPMSIIDPRLRQYVSENFPPEARNYVLQCGGIKELLMQSIQFAMIDNLICVRDHVVKTQDMACSEIKERMINPRYLISSCSSASSTSQLGGSGISHVSRGTSDSTPSVSKVSNGEVNQPKMNKPPLIKSGGGLEELDTFELPESLCLNPSAPEFEPRINEMSDEEEEGNNLNLENGSQGTSNWSAPTSEETLQGDVIKVNEKDKKDWGTGMELGDSTSVNNCADELFQSDDEQQEEEEEDDDDDDDEEQREVDNDDTTV
ncbi:E3 ubiquitin-protein ligase TTC3-like 1, partial [Homarus americanus]